MKINTVGLIGLGKMGGPIARRLSAAGYELLVHDRIAAAALSIRRRRVRVCRSPQELAAALPRPRIVLLCVPAGRTVGKLIEQLSPLLSKGDMLADLGNSFYRDSIRRHRALTKIGVDFIDVGMSGGIDGARAGACLMIGGAKGQAVKLDGIFKAISRNNSYEYFNRSGAGHLVKGFHNLIEYGYLQALAEGLESLYRISKKEKLNLDPAQVCGIWLKGSIIESRLLADAETAFKYNRALKGVSGAVRGQTLKEMRELVKIASASGVKNYSCAAAIRARLHSRKNPTYGGKIINAIRNVFGGHAEWK